MPKIGSKRDIPSLPRTTDEEPPKKAIKKEMPVSADKCSQQKSIFERTVSSTSESSSETDPTSTASESSIEIDTSSATPESSSEADSSSTTSEIKNIPISMLSLKQLLNRFNFLLSKNQNLTSFKIQGTPIKSEFNNTYKTLLLKIHPDKVGHEYEELFKSIFPICQELLKKLK